MTAASSPAQSSSIPPVSPVTANGVRIAELLTDLPLLRELIEGEKAAIYLGELSLLLDSHSRAGASGRARRFRRDQVVRIQVADRTLEEVGIMRDFSATGARISFQRSASFDAVQHDLLTLKVRLPSSPEQVVSIEARLVRLAANRGEEVQLAFSFTNNQQDVYFEALLEEIEKRDKESERLAEASQ